MSETTIFSKIINGEIPCDKLYEDEFCIAFNDISPEAPVHYLVIPKKAIVSLSKCMEEDEICLGDCSDAYLGRFDIGIFFFNLIGEYIKSQGMEWQIKPCFADGSCE